MSFKIGDRVTWKSQASSYVKVKTGVIEAIVPAGHLPSAEFQRLFRHGIGGPRDHESYVVRVRQATYYWPRVKGLERVSP
jgi:hypothetical protein